MENKECAVGAEIANLGEMTFSNCKVACGAVPQCEYVELKCGTTCNLYAACFSIIDSTCGGYMNQNTYGNGITFVCLLIKWQCMKALQNLRSFLHFCQAKAVRF